MGKVRRHFSDALALTLCGVTCRIRSRSASWLTN